MRVTDKMNIGRADKNIQKNRSEMGDLQNQVATQKRITKPSDDPTASARVLQMRTESQGSQQFVKNINMAKSFLEATDQSLAELSEALIRAKELAIQQASDAGASGDTRRTVAAEMQQIYQSALQIGNRKLGDRYIFGGFQTTKSPFDGEGQYRGDAGDMNIQINKDAFVAMNVSGDKIFHGKGLGGDGLIRAQTEVPANASEVRQLQQTEKQKAFEKQQAEDQAVTLRAPAMENAKEKVYSSKPEVDANGINVLQALKDFEIGLRVNDKDEIQAAIDNIDTSIAQIVNARAQVGARIMSLGAATDSLQKSIVDNKSTASQLEDADLFQVVSDITKQDTTLKATLETSGKIANTSLLDFLR